MILNSFELNLTEKKIKQIKATIAETEKNTLVFNFLLKLELDSLNVLLNELIKERTEFLEISKEFKKKTLVEKDVLKNPERLVYIRIANDIVQEDIARLLETNVEEIKRQEEYLYRNMHPTCLLKINEFLTERISNNLNVRNSEIDWGKFPITEMLKRKWLPLEATDLISIIKAQFEDVFGNNKYELALHRKFNFNGNSPNTYSLLAWQIQVLKKAKEIIKQNEVPNLTDDLAWLNQLASISTSPTGPLDAQEFLLSKGIILIVEPHLPFTYLDGAAMLLPNSSTPVIGLTLRHDRLDNFWFVLFHELGHIFLHLNEEHNFIFDEDVGLSTDQVEVEADKFALNNLIPLEQWDMCISRFYQDKDKLNEDAKNLNIHPSIIAGRIRKENNNYQIFNEQLGLNQVRKLFWSDKYDFE